MPSGEFVKFHLLHLYAKLGVFKLETMCNSLFKYE